MKNNQKPTLKSLQEQLTALKTNKNKDNDIKLSDIKNSSKGSQRISLHLKSSFLYLWLISWIPLFIKYIPIIGRIAILLKLYYGRTSIWKILVKLRKIFIIFNAIIGVFIVMKLAGIGTGTILANYVNMGNVYIEIFYNFVNKIFNFILDYLGYDIKPKSGGGFNTTWWPGPKSQTWYTNPMNTNNYLDIFNNSLKHPIKLIYDPTPWYKDWHTYLYIGGSLLFIGTLAVFGLLGYSYYQEVYGLSRDITPRGNSTPGGGLPDPGASVGESILAGLLTIKRNTIDYLNPISWVNKLYLNFKSDASAYKTLMDSQSNIHTLNNKFYPFTEINPNASLFHRIKILTLGESTSELAKRMADRTLALKATIIGSMGNDYSPTSSVSSGIVTSGWKTPHTSNVGLGLKFESSTGLNSWIETSSSFTKVENAINSIPQTPRIKPFYVDNLAIEGMTADWNTPIPVETIKDKLPEVVVGEASGVLENIKSKIVKTIPLPVSPENIIKELPGYTEPISNYIIADPTPISGTLKVSEELIIASTPPLVGEKVLLELPQITPEVKSVELPSVSKIISNYIDPVTNLEYPPLTFIGEYAYTLNNSHYFNVDVKTGKILSGPFISKL